jgi:hypothetical protein
LWNRIRIFTAPTILFWLGKTQNEESHPSRASEGRIVKIIKYQGGRGGEWGGGEQMKYAYYLIDLHSRIFAEIFYNLTISCAHLLTYLTNS